MDQADYKPHVDLPGSKADPIDIRGPQRVIGRLILYGVTSTKENCLWTKLPDSSAMTMLHARVAALKFLANL